MRTNRKHTVDQIDPQKEKPISPFRKSFKKSVIARELSMENNKKYKLTNIHNAVTIVRTVGNKVYIVEGFSTGYAGTIKEFMQFVVEKAKENQPIKIEEIKA